ncbi:S-layer homology domain-containing protein [Paenibacillus guangzhouensis]|uniref:S-layer homology domain-containing protein n=1 Tax=Paenibacillus guangzhouensis TaxID=1473112 RepID=UPI00126748A8|nr:S-layer homology domain-containing protein [Paenibacillus guangzhouensis]
MKKTLAKYLLVTMGLTTAIPTTFAGSPIAVERKFSDIATLSAERQAAILQAQQMGLFTGDSTGRFHPYGLTSRQEMAVVLASTLQLPLKKGSTPSFTDVKKTDWTASAIEAVYRAGLMGEVGNGKFRPTASLTYEELAVILDRAARWQSNVQATAPVSADFSKVSVWAKPSVTRAFGEGVMGTKEGGFQPKSFVQRQDLAEIVLHTFFPENHPSSLQRISDDSVQINGIQYTLANNVKGVLRIANAAVLKGAKIRFVANGRTIERITSLEITRSGAEPSANGAEFSGNLMLDGSGSAIDGNLTVSGDFISLNNVHVTGNLEISSKLAHDFYSNGLKVTGHTLVNGGDSNTVVFDNASLGQVSVNKQDVRVEALGSSKIDNVSVSSNASLVFDGHGTVSKVTLQEGASKVELTGTVSSLALTGNQATTLSGNANIGELIVSSATQVNLNVTGTVQQLTVNDPKAAVTLSSDTKVSNVTLGPGVSGSAVTTTPAAQKSTSSAAQESTPVAEVNRPPVVERTLPDLMFDLSDGDQYVDVNGLFSDPDNDKLTMAPQTSNKNIVKAAQTGMTVTLTPVAAGTAVITMRVNDGKGHVVSTSFNVKVTSVPNQPPVSLDIPDQSLEAGTATKDIDLSLYFSDPENEALTYTATVQNGALATASVIGNKLSITPLAEGETTIHVTAQDPKGARASKTIVLKVTRANVPNQPPVGLDIPDQSLEAGTAAKDIDLSLYFSDPENEALSYTATVQDETLATVSVIGSKLSITPLAEGETTIQVTVQDPKGATASKTIVLKVTPANNTNQPPVSLDMPDQSLEAGTAAKDIDLSLYFSDPENEALTYTATVQNGALATAVVTGSKLSITPLAEGETTILVTAQDPKGATASKTIVLKVTPTNVPNQPPVGLDMPDQSLEAGTTAKDIDLSAYFSDPENEALTYTATVQNGALATASVIGNKLSITPLAEGETTIEVTAQDPKGATASKTIVLKVTSANVPNQPPVGLDMPDQSLGAGTAAKDIDLSLYFSDPENEALTYTATVQNGALATAVVTGSKLSITPLAEGVTTIEVTATDPKGAYTSRTINLTVTAAAVTPPNKPPVVVAAIQTQLLSPGYTNTRSYDLSQLFEDPDGDAMTFIAVVSNPNAAQATVNGSELTLSPGKAGHTGSVTVTITATDSNGGSATYNLTVLSVQLVDKGFVEINTKVGVPNLTYDLKSQFPGQSNFNVYFATPDQTLMGPTPLNGTVWASAPMNGDYWIIGADNKAVLLRVNVKAQVSGEAYFSQYIDGGDYNKALQIRNPYFGTAQRFTGYSIDVYHYNPGTNAITSATTNIFQIPVQNIQDIDNVNVIDGAFYDFFDVINAVYYNVELNLNVPGKKLIAIVLKHNGNVIDVLGDPTSHDEFMPTGGTIIRKAAIYSGSAKFSETGEWNVYAKGTYQYFNQRTP